MIYFMRHGEDLKGYVGGWSDVPLTEKGKRKVLKNAKWIKKNLNIKRIITSDVNRAVESAEIVKNVLGIEYEKCILLREQSKGTLTGKASDSLTEYEKNLLDFQEIDTIFPNGESLINLHDRIKNNLSFFSSLEDNTLLITHRGVINSFYYIFNNIELDMNKKQFKVKFASIHEADFNLSIIKRIK